ncbi:MAG: hypothetical protein ABSD57_08085, partial [Verrucomicrobiota bacterium]
APLSQISKRAKHPDRTLAFQAPHLFRGRQLQWNLHAQMHVIGLHLYLLHLTVNVIFALPNRMRQPFESAHVLSFLVRCGTTLRKDFHGQILSSMALSLTPFREWGSLC